MREKQCEEYENILKKEKQRLDIVKLKEKLLAKPVDVDVDCLKEPYVYYYLYTLRSKEEFEYIYDTFKCKDLFCSWIIFRGDLDETKFPCKCLIKSDFRGHEDRLEFQNYTFIPVKSIIAHLKGDIAKLRAL